jgi:hypothetical protein
MERAWLPPDGCACDEHAGANGASRPQLVLYNSYVDRKVPFVPAAGPDSRQISWYTCGPTVYDSAHVGHARNYLSFDIVRRVLEDYFGFNITYVMNVTDVDDKIILRARRNYLLENYKRQTQDPQQVQFGEVEVGVGGMGWQWPVRAVGHCFQLVPCKNSGMLVAGSGHDGVVSGQQGC